MIWSELVNEQRKVSRPAYEALAAETPALRPKTVHLAFAAGEDPTPLAPKKAKPRGRRPSHAANATTARRS